MYKEEKNKYRRFVIVTSSKRAKRQPYAVIAAGFKN